MVSYAGMAEPDLVPHLVITIHLVVHNGITPAGMRRRETATGIAGVVSARLLIAPVLGWSVQCPFAVTLTSDNARSVISC